MSCASATFKLSYGCALLQILLIRTPSTRSVLDPVSPLWLRAAIPGLCLTPAAFTRPDPALWIDVWALSWTCLAT